MLSFLVSQYMIINTTAPELSPETVIKLLYLVNKNAIVYNIPADLFVSIMAQESKFKVSAINKKTGDRGIMQINPVNIKKKKMDKRRLVTDVAYSVQRGAEILSWFRQKYPDEKDWFVRYNCGTKRECPKWASSKEYIAKIKGRLQ